MTTHYDTVVVGAGFAGLIVARELSRSGQRVAVLEARDRIGGRTWYGSRLGRELELGGTWVHWTQPHVWAELARYGIPLAPSPVPEQAYWWDGRQAMAGNPDELLELLDQPNELLTAAAREAFPQPFRPLESAAFEPYDAIAVPDEIARLPLRDDERSLLTSFWTLNFNGRLEDAALSQALRWVALANGDWKVMFEACATYKIAGGTSALAEAICQDIKADFHLNADVQRIISDEAGASVQTASGDVLTADDVVLTVPLHALSRIALQPPLPQAVQHGVERGQLGLGTKVWFTVEGEVPPFVALGDADWPLNFFQSEYTQDGKSYVIGFGPDAALIDAADSAAVQEILNRLVPDLHVLETSGHNWVEDPYAQETWPMHRVGYMTHTLPELQRPHGRVRFAGSDVANGWGGFIDGAIESGLTTARQILSQTPASDTHAAAQPPALLTSRKNRP